MKRVWYAIQPRGACLVWLVAAWLAMSGCGGRTGPEKAVVSGRVTLDGVPVEDGTIAFIPTGNGPGGPTAGAMIKQGTYRTLAGKGPVLGPHRVEIIAYRPGKSVEVQGVGGATTGLSGTAAVQELELYIPEQFNKHSTLTVVVVSGENEVNFELASKS